MFCSVICMLIKIHLLPLPSPAFLQKLALHCLWSPKQCFGKFCKSLRSAVELPVLLKWHISWDVYNCKISVFFHQHLQCTDKITLDGMIGALYLLEKSAIWYPDTYRWITITDHPHVSKSMHPFRRFKAFYNYVTLHGTGWLRPILFTLMYWYSAGALMCNRTDRTIFVVYSYV